MNVLVYVPYLYNTAPGQRFRLEQWAKLLEPKGVNFHFVPFESEILNQIWHKQDHHARKVTELLRSIFRRLDALKLARNGWDIAIVHRELLPIGPAILERFLSRKGIPMLYDFDDAIFLPDVSDANRRFRWLKCPKKTGTICRLSTHTIVGNEYLKAYALQYTDRVSVIPTTIDTDHYVPKAHVDIDGLAVIGWSGSLTTLKHLRWIEPALKALHRVKPFRLKVIGTERYRSEDLDVECKSWNAEREVTDLQSFDIGIMPLPDDPWAKGKCGLKALQYMAVGVPTVASPVGVNQEIIRDGHNGFLASTHTEWVEKLSHLLENQKLREEFSREGRRTVEQKYSAKIQAHRFLTLLEQILRETDNTKFCFAPPPAGVCCRQTVAVRLAVGDPAGGGVAEF